MLIDIRLLAPIATCLAIAVSIVLWFLNQHKKELAYMILERHPVLNLKGAARNQLDIRFDGHSILDSYLIVVRIFNRGHLPINVSDYQTAMFVGLNPGAEILAASVIETIPADLEERIKAKTPSAALIEKIVQERIFLTPILLNEGDSITVQLLARNTVGAVDVHGHIQGIKRIICWREKRIWTKVLTYSGAMIMTFAMLGVEPQDIVELSLEHILPWILIFFIGLTLLTAGIYWPKSAESMSLQAANQ
jgi:hypothetical protein